MTNEYTRLSSGQDRNTIVVIQCASRKQSDAGHLRTQDGKRVMFVAAPRLAPEGDGLIYARPDDVSDTGRTWRDVLRDYNSSSETNPLGLLPAWRLYCPQTYQRLKNSFGLDRLFILSAGWGMIPANFLTPNYDITFSSGKGVEKFKRRTPSSTFHDFQFHPADSATPIVFFGGKKYVPMFCSLTAEAKNRRIVYYAGSEPAAPGCSLRSFGKPYTNWHYKCAEAFAGDGCDSYRAA